MVNPGTAKARDDLVLLSLWNCLAFVEGQVPKLWKLGLELVAAFRRRGRDVTGALSSGESFLGSSWK